MTDYERQLQSTLAIVLKMAIDQREAFIKLTQLVVSKLPNVTADDKAAISAAYASSEKDIARLRALVDQMGRS